jgi:hypothetical protein
MIDAKQIPDEVFEAFQKAWTKRETLSTKECLAAALNAWPNWSISPYAPAKIGHDYLTLPLPKDAADE